MDRAGRHAAGPRPAGHAGGGGRGRDQLVRIGFDRLVGVLDGGVERWAAEGRPVAEIATVTASTLADELRAGDRLPIVDVRDEAEMRADGRLDDAVALPLAGLIAGKDLAPRRAPRSPSLASPAAATVAAGLLEARGHPVRLVPRGGIQDVVERLAGRRATRDVHRQLDRHRARGGTPARPRRHPRHTASGPVPPPVGRDGRPKAYLAGQSLGRNPKAARAAVEQRLDAWARLGVDGWFDPGRPWIDVERELAEATGRLVGAAPVEVTTANTLSIDLHLLLASFYGRTPSGGGS